MLIRERRWRPSRLFREDLGGRSLVKTENGGVGLKWRGDFVSVTVL